MNVFLSLIRKKPVSQMLLLAFCLMAAPAYSASYEEVKDLSNLPLLNSDLKERKTAKISLPNGLQALLISDPKADQSAASVAVHAGSWNDPDEYPGMAHFCEHMLFMGTERFPQENEFSTLIANYRGMLNAYTAPDRTVYMFSSGHDGLVPLLERFARFFIDPLFHPSGISRELHAVDQEFSKNIEHDGWREYMIFKETSNPNHPNIKFSTGNSETLGSIPQSALKEWHQAHYSAEKMRLVLYSPLPLKEMAELAANLFSPVPVAEPLKEVFEQEITSPTQRGALTSIQPIQEKQMLTLSWEIPPHLGLDSSRPAHLFCYALERGQVHSLKEVLKKEGLIEDAAFNVEDLGGPAHRLLQIQLELTDKGLTNWKTVALRCFQAIHQLSSNGVPSYLFEEMNQSGAMKYQYQSRQEAFSFVMKLSASLLDEELSTFPKAQILSASYNPQILSELTQWLTPENCLFTLMADSKKTKILPTAKERWLGGEYAMKEIAKGQLTEWKLAQPHQEIRIADPNPFMPSSFALLPKRSSKKRVAQPTKISEDDFGSAYYARLEEFQSPEVSFALHFLSPKIGSSETLSILGSLYLESLKNRLDSTLSQAEDGGLQAKFQLERNRINLQIDGFSDKATLLLQEILKELSSPIHTTKEEFEVLKALHRKKYANASFDLPCRQAKEIALSLIDPDRKTRKEKLLFLDKISYEDFLAFCRSLFEETYTEAFFTGNLSLKDAQSAWLDVRHLIGSKPFPRNKQPQTKILALSNSGPFAICETTEALGSAAFLLLDQGNFSFEKRASQEILSASLREAFFNTLRTKQKTGYIVQSDDLEMELRLFQYFLVQSNSHEPDELLQRFELFLETALQELPEAITEERFTTLKSNLVQQIQSQTERNLKEKSALLDKLAFQLGGDFSWIEKRLAGFDRLTYDTFLKEASQFLSRENRKRLAILLEGKKQKRFAYEAVGLEQIRKNERYLTRFEIE